MSLTPTGLEIKTLETIKAEIEASLLANLGPGVNLQSDGIVGQFVGITSSLLAELWEVTQAVDSSQYPDSASGVSLDRVGALTGAVRLPATKSTGTITITGTPATNIPIGRIVKTLAGDRFTTTATVVIGGGGTIDAAVESVEFGAVPANAATLTIIETLVAGWASVTNAADVLIGREIETDADFRLRRVQLLARAGDATVDAIRSDVLAVAGVTAAFVFENTSLVTDGDGVPGKAFEVVVQGGDDTAIATAIFNSKPAGILAHGATPVVITDSAGNDHTIGLTRPTELEIEYTGWVFDVTDAAPADVVQQIIDAMAAFTNGLGIGRDVFFYQLVAYVFIHVAGIQELVNGSFNVIGSPPPSGSSIPVGPRELAKVDTSDIAVSVNVVDLT